MTVILLVVLGVFAVVVHREVESALRRVAEARLLTASDRLATLLARSPAERLDTLRALAGRERVTAFLRDPTPAGRESARALLDSVAGTVSAPGGLLLTGPATVSTLDTAGWSGVIAAAPAAGIGPLIPADGFAYALSVPVVVGADTLGRMVEARRIASSPDAGGAIADLIGRDATFLLGNRAGDAWTDLTGPVAGPPAGMTAGEVAVADFGSGGPVYGILEAIPGTPWAVWVALPEAVVMAPLRALLLRLAAVVGALLVAGGTGAWLVGRWITAPLRRLTEAAEHVARGDYSSRVASDRSDEIGRLGAAFDLMAEHVEESRHRLEERVAERTAELQRTLHELEEAQEELVRKERLALLGELAGGVGHELRNPLGVMTNAVFYLRAVLDERTGDVDEYLDILSQQIHVSEKIVSDLLDFARVKPPQRRPTDLAALAEAQLERTDAPEEVEVRRRFPPDLPPADVDPDQIAQVVLNLVANALQAMQENGGGTLTFSGEADGQHVTLEVGDTGPGIPEETLQRIFEPLFTTRAKGIGLGLSVSRSLTEANEGRLEVVTVPGEGTTFVLTVPRAGGSP